METHAPYAQWIEGGTLDIDTAPASVTVTPSPNVIASGATVQLTATATGSDGLPMAATYAWTSTEPDAGTVSPSGLVTGAGGGVTFVRATASNGVYGQARVAVGTPLYLVLSGGAYVFSDTGPATASLAYNTGTGLLQVDSDPAAANALEAHGVPSGSHTLVTLSNT